MNENSNAVPYEKWPWWVKLYSMTIKVRNDQPISGSAKVMVRLLIIIQVLLYFKLLGRGSSPVGFLPYLYVVCTIFSLTYVQAVWWLDRHSSCSELVACKTKARTLVASVVLILGAGLLVTAPYLLNRL